MTAEQTPDIERVLAEHEWCQYVEYGPCTCGDLTAFTAATHRAHVAQALAPVLAAAVREALRNPYDEDGYCEFCGNGSWKAHMPECAWADLRDARQQALSEAADELPGGLPSNGARKWLRARADRVAEPQHEAATSGKESEASDE